MAVLGRRGAAGRRGRPPRPLGLRRRRPPPSRGRDPAHAVRRPVGHGRAGCGHATGRGRAYEIARGAGGRRQRPAGLPGAAEPGPAPRPDAPGPPRGARASRRPQHPGPHPSTARERRPSAGCGPPSRHCSARSTSAAVEARSGALARLLASMSASVAQHLRRPLRWRCRDDRDRPLQDVLANEHAAVYVCGVLGRPDLAVGRSRALRRRSAPRTTPIAAGGTT